MCPWFFKVNPGRCPGGGNCGPCRIRLHLVDQEHIGHGWSHPYGKVWAAQPDKDHGKGAQGQLTAFMSDPWSWCTRIWVPHCDERSQLPKGGGDDPVSSKGMPAIDGANAAGLPQTPAADFKQYPRCQRQVLSFKSKTPKRLEGGRHRPGGWASTLFGPWRFRQS